MGALPEPTNLPDTRFTEKEAERLKRFEIVHRTSFARVPTHAIGVVHERRVYPRAALRLPLRLTAVAGKEEPVPVTLVTRNISSNGVYFLCPRRIEAGTAIDLEVALVERPLSPAQVRMVTAAHVVRVEPAEIPGWHGLAATFDDIGFERNEPGLSHLETP